MTAIPCRYRRRGQVRCLKPTQASPGFARAKAGVVVAELVCVGQFAQRRRCLTPTRVQAEQVGCARKIRIAGEDQLRPEIPFVVPDELPRAKLAGWFSVVRVQLELCEPCAEFARRFTPIDAPRVTRQRCFAIGESEVREDLLANIRAALDEQKAVFAVVQRVGAGSLGQVVDDGGLDLRRQFRLANDGVNRAPGNSRRVAIRANAARGPRVPWHRQAPGGDRRQRCHSG